MESNISLRKHVNQTPPMQHIIAYIKENFKIKSEENYDDGTDTKMIAFENDELIFILDIYPASPNHLRVYILFEDEFSIELLDKANGISRFAKGSLVEQKKGTRLCIEVEQMMYGLQSRSTSEKYIKLATEYLTKFMDILTDLEDESGQEAR